jgi:two-component system sensor kinase FixL
MLPGESTLDRFRDLFCSREWGATGLGPRESWPLLLRRSTELLLDTPQASFITWGDQHAILFNGAFADWLGGGVEWLGRPISEVWGSAWDSVAPHFHSALEGRGVLAEDIEIPTSSSDGSESRRATCSFAPLRAFDSHVIGVISICTETTEKVRAMARLAQEHEGLVRILEDAPGFVGKMSVPDFRFIAANRAYRRLVGERELLGRRIGDALPELAGQGIVGILEEVRDSGQPFVARSLCLTLDNPGGEERKVIDLVCAPLKDWAGAVEAIFVAGHDLTDHVRSIERVEELQNELIHLSRVSAMGTMASTLGHELNQPLTAIVNYASVARRSIREDAGGHLVEALDAISEGALRAGRLIRSVRTMSRKAGTHQAAFAVTEAVNEAIKLGGLACGCQIKTGVPKALQAYGDRVQIEQILINLVRNACEASTDVAEPCVEIAARQVAGKAVITVSDTGCGIPFEPIEKVFAPFMSTKPEGIGIGLPISRTIAEAHGGRLWAENRKGGGAAFHLELPCRGPG